MAHIRKTAAGTWQARYRAPDGSERARNFTRKIDAETFLATVETDMLRGDWTDPRRSRITFGEWNTRVQEGRVNPAASTRDSDGSVIRSLILPTFEHSAIASIEPGHIRTWVTDLVAAGYSPSPSAAPTPCSSSLSTWPSKTVVSLDHPAAVSPSPASSNRRNGSSPSQKSKTSRKPSDLDTEPWS